VVISEEGGEVIRGVKPPDHMTVGEKKKVHGVSSKEVIEEKVIRLLVKGAKGIWMIE